MPDRWGKSERRSAGGAGFMLSRRSSSRTTGRRGLGRSRILPRGRLAQPDLPAVVAVDLLGGAGVRIEPEESIRERAEQQLSVRQHRDGRGIRDIVRLDDL